MFAVAAARQQLFQSNLYRGASCRPSNASFNSSIPARRLHVSRYDSAGGGHFHRHRDNGNVGAQHQRFAVIKNLNVETTRAAIWFSRSSGAAMGGGGGFFHAAPLHQVRLVTKGP